MYELRGLEKESLAFSKLKQITNIIQPYSYSYCHKSNKIINTGNIRCVQSN